MCIRRQKRTVTELRGSISAVDSTVGYMFPSLETSFEPHAESPHDRFGVSLVTRSDIVDNSLENTGKIVVELIDKYFHVDSCHTYPLRNDTR